MPSQCGGAVVGVMLRWWTFHHFSRYKEHEDGFWRLQLIRYESVELTEQLMREKQNRQTDEDQDQEMDEESAGPAPMELQHELRGVLLEEQRVEDSANGTEEDGQEEAPPYTFTRGFS